MRNRIRFGIIGCSSIAHRSVIPAIRDAYLAQLEIIGSRSVEKAKKFARKFSCDTDGNYEDVLERKNVNAVYISLPPALSEEWVVKSASAGKHIICEKPAALSYESAKKMIAACRKNNVRILEGLSFRFHPQNVAVLKIIEKNTLGKLFSFSGFYGFNLVYSKENFRFKKKLGGGVLNDVGCYLICASRMVFRDKPSTIACNLDVNKKTGIDIRGSIHMTYPGRRVALVAFGYDVFFRSTYNVWGNRGFVNLRRAFNVRKNMSALIKLEIENKIKHVKFKPADQYKLMIEEFCKELQNSKTSKFNFEEDLLAQAQVMEAARQSQLKKRTIYVNEI